MGNYESTNYQIDSAPTCHLKKISSRFITKRSGQHSFAGEKKLLKSKIGSFKTNGQIV
jgi:hypothetical protein